MKAIYLVFACLAFCDSANALDCWVPTRDTTQPEYRKDALPAIRGLMSTTEQVVRDNPHFKAMPRPIRIRASYSVGPSHGHMNINAYQPDVWAQGKCDVVPGADRCCRDGGITVMVNAPETTASTHAAKDELVTYYQQPKRTGTVAGYPEFEGKVFLSLNGRLPWIPASVAEYLGFQERQVLKSREDFRKRRPAFYGQDLKTVEKAYENMKKLDAKAAESYRATALAQNDALAAQQRKTEETAELHFTRQLDEIAKVRASFTAEQLAAQAYHGIGPLNLGRAEDPRSVGLVKPDPEFFDRTQRDRVQLITVYVGVAPNDPVAERQATMQRTKDTFDYQRLAKFLR
jgi:hypothetical protein